MTALTAPRKTQRRVRPADHYWDYPRGASQVFHGSLVGLLAGVVVPVSANSSIKVGGRASVANAISADTAGDRIRVEDGVARWANGDAITMASNFLGPCYGGDDQTVYADSLNGTRPFAGIILDVDTFGVWVLSSPDLAGAVTAGAGVGTLVFPINGFHEADGTPLADFADGVSTTPGYDMVANEAWGIRWNNDAAPDPIAQGVPIPADLDPSQPIVLAVLASKIGATVGDAVVWLIEAFLVGDGDLHDADADAGGSSTAMTGDAATKTMQAETLIIAAADVPDSPAGGLFTLTIQPTDGTLGTDDVILHSVIGAYARKVS